MQVLTDQGLAAVLRDCDKDDDIFGGHGWNARRCKHADGVQHLVQRVYEQEESLAWGKMGSSKYVSAQ